jgi:hypothetical protein
MKPIIVNRYEQQEKENEQKLLWIESILTNLGISINEWKVVEPNTNMMANLRKIRDNLRALDLDIVDNCSCGISIYFKGKLIAEFLKPHYKLKEKINEKDIKFRYYYEMYLNTKTYFKES